MNGFRTFLQENKVFKGALRVLLVLLYVVLFTYVTFSENSLMVARNINDHLTQQGVNRSDEIVVVSIKPTEETRYNKSADLLCAEAVKYMNENGSPAVIGIELPETAMSEKAFALLGDAASAGNLVFPAEISIPQTAVNSMPLNTESPRAGFVKTYPAAVTEKARTAHTVHLTDTDGVLRHMTFELQGKDGKTYPSMAWACYEQYCAKQGLEAKVPNGKENDSVLIKFSDDYDIYTISAGDIINGTADPALWKDKIVLIGSFDTALDKGYRTAIDHEYRMYSVQVDAESVNALLTGSTAVTEKAVNQALVLAVCVLLTIICMTRIKSLAGDICYIALYELSAVVFAMLLFGVGHNWLVFPHLANGIVTGIVFIGITGLYRSRNSRYELERVLGKYMDNRVVGDLLKEENRELIEPVPDVIGGHTVKVAVLFADIRQFTTISENMQSDCLVRMLNDYLSMMSECVERYGGTVDKFIGDCIMAYWGAPVGDDDPVYHACLAASEIRRRAAEAAQKMKDRFEKEINIGIGISYGDVVVGNIGSANRMNFTVIGDTVNVASRLESIAPGGEIYLSEDAAERLQGVSELKKLPDKVKLKGRETPLAVYALQSISVRGSMNRKKKEEQAGKAAFRRRAYVATGVNFLLSFLQFIFVINTIRSYGIGFLSYFTVILAAISCSVSVLLIPYDLRAAERADGENLRPRWLDVAMLAALMVNLQSAIAVLVREVPTMGLEAYSSSGWPGGATIYLVCPLLSLISFFLLEPRADYRFRDVLKAEVLPALLLLGSAGFAYAAGLDRKTPQLYSVFYETPVMLLTILLQTAGLAIIVLISRKLRLQDRFSIDREFRIGRHLKMFRQTKLYRFFISDLNRMLLRVGLNLLIGILAFRVTRTAVLAGGIHMYSNPSLTGFIILITCILSIILIVMAYVRKEPLSRLHSYKYVSFIRNLGCSINFFSVMLLAVSDEGISAFFTPRWSADGWFFVFVPLVSFFLWITERNEYRLPKLLLTPVPYAVLLPFSRAAIFGQGLELQYAYEIENYYSLSAIIAMIVAEFLLVGLMYVVNMLGCRMFRESERDEGVCVFTVCGCRYGITAGKKTESVFGLRSECYVLREGNYGMVIGAGSGLALAPVKLAGCTHVDILLGSSNFRDIMGFLTAPFVCPGAEVRIISPFGAERFSVNPFWPVNLIRKNCLTVTAGKPYRLNDSYSVLFTAADDTGTNYMVRLDGAVTVCYTGQNPAPEESVRKWSLGADLLIYSAGDTWERGCYITIDNGIPALLLSGAPIEFTDELLTWKEHKAGALYAEVHIAREGMTFPLRR